MKKAILATFIATAFCGCFALHADTVVFKNGQELDGDILEKDENSLKLQVEFGTILVPMSRVRTIEADTPEKIELRAKKKAEAEELAKQMKEEGKVQYKGKWVSEEEKKADEAKVAEVKKKKKEEDDAKRKKAEEAAKRASEEAQKLAALNQASNNNNGNGNSRNNRFDRNHNSRDNSYNNNSNGMMGNSSNNYSGGYQSNVLNNNYRGGR
ncbi:MAG: hypothetical protein WCT04_13815 [Planctomycetota bacterium]